MWERLYTVQNIKIKWKLKPPRVEILLLLKSNLWKVMINEKPEDDLDIKFVPVEIRGMKVIMLDMDTTEEIFNVKS